MVKNDLESLKKTNAELLLALRDAQKTIAEYSAAYDSKLRLVRKLDVLLNGEAGAAKQASLCDIVARVEAEGIRAPAANAGVLPPLPPFGIDVPRIEGFKAAQMEQYARDAIALNRTPTADAGGLVKTEVLYQSCQVALGDLMNEHADYRAAVVRKLQRVEGMPLPAVQYSNHGEVWVDAAAACLAAVRAIDDRVSTTSAAGHGQPYVVVRYVEKVGGPLGNEYGFVRKDEWDNGLSRAIAEECCDGNKQPLVAAGIFGRAPATSAANQSIITHAGAAIMEQAAKDVLCPACQGAGSIETGIAEAPTTLCNKCDGTGARAAAKGAGDQGGAS